MFVPVRWTRGVLGLREERGVGGGFSGDQGPVSVCSGEDDSVGFGGVTLRRSVFFEGASLDGDKDTCSAALIGTERRTRVVDFGEDSGTGASNSSDLLAHASTDKGWASRARRSISAAVSQ